MKAIAFSIMFVAVVIVLFVAIRMMWPNSFPDSQVNRSFAHTPKHTIAYYQRGRGQDVLLIHGTPGSIEDWLQLYDNVDLNKYSLTSFDRPGHGASSTEGIEGRIEDNVDAALAVITALDLRRVVVVGHSYGGTTALALALRNDPRVAGVVALGPPVVRWEKINPVYYPLAVPGINRMIAELLIPLLAKPMVEDGILSCFANDPERIPNGFVAFRKKLWARPHAIISKAKEMVRLDSELRVLTSRLKRISQPGVIVLGALDQEGIVSSNREVAQAIPNLKLIELQEVGHYPQVEKPGAIVQAIEQVLSQADFDVK